MASGNKGIAGEIDVETGMCNGDLRIVNHAGLSHLKLDRIVLQGLHSRLLAYLEYRRRTEIGEAAKICLRIEDGVVEFCSFERRPKLDVSGGIACE